MHSMKIMYLVCASAMSIAAAVPALAQSEPTGQTPQTEPTQNPVAAGAVTPPPRGGQEDYQSANDIVVTATRRNETVQEVPVAITAVGAELLRDAGVVDIRGLEQLAPSLQTTTGQSAATGSSLSIRGVGTAGDNPGFEPAVGVFIDGVFRARAGVALSELPELQRVEILRGPQGTLFGRNTSAGAVSIYTALPAFELGGYVQGSYGNYDAYEAKGAITGPVSEHIALRFDGGYRKRDGYIADANSDRRLNNIDRYNLRGQALYDSADLTFRLIADYNKTDEQCCGAVSVVRGSTFPAIQAIAAAQGLVGLYTGAPSDRIQAFSPNRDYSERVRDYGVSGELNLDIGALKLTSITAYRSWRALRSQDIDFSGIDRAYRNGYRSELDDFTQEFRVQGSALGGVLDFLVGGFYLNEKNKLRDTVRVGNDANRYTDTLLSGALSAPPAAGGIGRPAQFFGSFAIPTFAQLVGSVSGGPGLPAGTVPLLSQLLYLQSPQLQAAAPPGSPLFAYFNTPLTGSVAGQGNNNDDFRVATEAFALFTHNIVNITDELSLTLGARFNHERKKLTASINNNTASCSTFLSADPRAQALTAAFRAASPTLFANLFLLSCNPAVNTEFNGNYSDSKSESKVTGTVKLAYKLTPDILTYASFDRGYKSGGYNLDQATFDTRVLGGNGAQGSDLGFGSETVDAYELGVKTRFGRGFTLNVAGFYQKFRGLQSLIFSGNNFIVQNINAATSKGVEAEAVLQPVRDLVFRMGYTYLDGQFDRSNNFAGTPLAGYEGRPFRNQPQNVVTIAGSWTPALTGKLRGLLHADMRYNSAVNIEGPLNAAGRTAVYNTDYPLVAARVGIQADDKTKSLEFWVENLTNQYYHITGFSVPEQTGTYAGYPSMPRMYGITARFGF